MRSKVFLLALRVRACASLSEVFFVACELGVFNLLPKAPDGSAVMAARLGPGSHGTELLLDACASLKLYQVETRRGEGKRCLAFCRRRLKFALSCHFCKGPESQCLQNVGHVVLAAAALGGLGARRPDVNECACLGSYKTSFTETSVGPELAPGLQHADPGSRDFHVLLCTRTL